MTDLSLRRWARGLPIVIAAWVVAFVWLGPWFIRNAYRERLGPLNGIISGRDVHPVESYLDAWSRIGWKATVVVAVAGGLVWVTAWALPRLRAAKRLGRRARRGGLAALFALAALWAIASLWFPFGWDHGIMAAVGDVIVRGGMPYADGWDMKGPLPYYVFAFAQWIAGPQVWGVRLLDLALVIVASAALGRMAGRLTSPAVAPWVGLALFLWYASLGYFFTAQPDGWVGLGMAIGLASLIDRARPSHGAYLLAGLVIGLATLVKPIFGAFLAVPLLHLALARRDGEVRTFSHALALIGAFVGPVAVAIGWFAARGALDDLWNVHFSYAARSYAYVGSPQLGARLAGTLEFLWSEEIAVLLPILLLGAHAAWRIDRRAGLLLCGWAAVALFTVVLQGKFFEYHWIPTFPPLVVLTTAGLFALLVPSNGPRSSGGVPDFARTLGIIAVVVGLVRVAYLPASAVAQFAPFALGRIDSDQYYGQFGLSGAPYSPGDERRAARYLRTVTDATDGLVIFGTNAGIHYLSRRAAPTRFVFSLPLTGPRGPTRRAYREEFLADLRRAPPLYIVVGMTIRGGPKEDELAGFPEFAQFLDRSYTLDRTIGHLDLYRRDQQGT